MRKSKNIIDQGSFYTAEIVDGYVFKKIFTSIHPNLSNKRKMVDDFVNQKEIVISFRPVDNGDKDD